MTPLITRLITPAVILATAIGLNASVGAQDSFQVSDQQDLERADSSGDETALAEATTFDTPAQSYWWPATAGFDFLCFPNAAPCGDSARLWLRGRYLLWWTKGNPLPALVSTSLPETPWVQAGVPGSPGFEVLFGGRNIADEARGGGWLTLGYWLDDDRTVGLQVDWFLVGNDKNTGSFAADSGGTPILARPFYDVSASQADAAKVAFPNVVAGAIAVATSSELNSGGVLLRRHLTSGGQSRIDLLGGYRHFCWREDLTIADGRTLLVPVGICPTGTTLDSSDHIAAENDFDGGELGVTAEFQHASWSLNLSGKVAVGRVLQELDIDGSTKIVTPKTDTAPAQTFVHEGGLLTQPTNIGSYSRSELGVLPELDVTLEYHVTERFSLMLGYTLVCLNHVLRTGDQVDTAVNSTQLADFAQPAGGTLVGEPRPAVLLRDSAFWAQGISLGVQLAR